MLIKILITTFVLFVSSSVLSEDISDFQIEGISIGDSALDYFNKSEIINNLLYDNIYTSDTYSTFELYKHKSLKKYDAISISFKKGDTLFAIQSVSGIIFYKSNIDNCYKDFEKVSDDLSLTFKHINKVSSDKNHAADPTGESKSKGAYFWLDSGALASVECYDWSDKLTESNGWTDNLNVYLSSKEFADWLQNEAYK